MEVSKKGPGVVVSAVPRNGILALTSDSDSEERDSKRPNAAHLITLRVLTHPPTINESSFPFSILRNPSTTLSNELHILISYLRLSKCVLNEEWYTHNHGTNVPGCRSQRGYHIFDNDSDIPPECIAC